LDTDEHGVTRNDLVAYSYSDPCFSVFVRVQKSCNPVNPRPISTNQLMFAFDLEAEGLHALVEEGAVAVDSGDLGEVVLGRR